MACSLVLKADNGKPSNLFKSITEVVENPDEAIDLYLFTKTDEFKNLYGNYTAPDYKGPALDENGEPVYSTISKDAFQYDEEYLSTDLANRGEVYKDLLKRVPQIVQTIGDRIDHLKKVSGGKSKTIGKLEELEAVLMTGPINESIPKFLTMSNHHLIYLRNEVEKLIKEPETDVRRLAGIYKAAKAYEVVADLRLELLGSDLDKLFEEGVSSISSTLDHIRAIESHYISKGKDHLAKEFHKRDKTWKISDIRKSLDTAPRDLNFHEQLLEYVGDSTDPVISMVGVIMMEAEHKIRREAIDFNKKIQPLIEKLEKKFEGNPYDKLIIEKNNGELHVVDINVEHTGGKDSDIDAEYDKLQEIKRDPDLYEFLGFFSSEYNKLQDMLGYAAPKMGTRIPTVLKSDWERVKGNSLKVSAEMMIDDAKKSIQRSNLDAERGTITDAQGYPVRRIPVFYTQKYDSTDYDALYKKYFDENIAAGMDATVAIREAHTKAEAEAVKKTSNFISRDLGHTLQMFQTMAMNYSAKNELITIFESAEAVVGSDFRQYTLVDSGGKPITNKHTGQVEMKSGATSNAKKVLTKFLDMQLYGQKELDLGYTEVAGVKIDTNAVLRKLGSASGLVQLSTNVLASINNICSGEYANLLEGVGGEQYTVKNLRKASGYYKENLAGVLGDIGARTPSNIVNLLNNHYYILQSFEQDIKSSERSKFSRMFGTSALFFMNNAGEHFLQMREGLAIMDGTQAYDSDGKELGSLLDLHKVEDGRLVVPDVYVKEKDGSLVKFDTNQQNRLSNRIGATLRFSHGNYSSTSAIAASQDARLALVVQFRKWMYPGLIKRFGRKQENRMLEKSTEGFYRAGSKTLLSFVKDAKDMKFSLMKENWSNLSPTEKANVRRLIMESSMIVLLAAAAAMFGKAGEYIEDEFGSDEFSDRLVKGSYLTTLYELNRMYTEVFAYANPAEAVKLMRTPVASVSILESTINVITQLTDPFEEYQAGWRKGDNKLITKIGKMVPIYKQLETLVPEGIQEKTRYYN